MMNDVGYCDICKETIPGQKRKSDGKFFDSYVEFHNKLPDVDISNIETRSSLKIKLEEIVCSDQKLDALLEKPFLIHLLLNKISRFYASSPHDPVVKSLFSRLAIRGDAYTASLISGLVGGPTLKTIRRAIAADIPILDHLCDENLKLHLAKYTEISYPGLKITHVGRSGLKIL